ncbi:MAG: trehalose utilization protein ThuA, partial [Mesorhizobium sp.]
AHNPQGSNPAILDAPNVPVEKALEPIIERGAKLHAEGEAGFR